MPQKEESHDERALRDLVAALYRLVSAPAGVAPAIDADCALLHPQVRLCRTVRGPDRTARQEIMDAAGYARSARALITDIGFFEVETHHEAFVYGDVAHVLSHYEAYADEQGGDPIKKGVNSIQLLRVHGRWQVFSMIWDDEVNRL